jgi:hypothetical protein
MARLNHNAKRQWSVSEIKANFSAFLKAADKAPQIITRRGKRVAEIRLLPSWKTQAKKQKNA